MKKVYADRIPYKFLCFEMMNRKLILTLVFLWELPQNLLGIVVLAVIMVRKSILKFELKNHLFCIETQNIGLSLGWFVFWTPSGNRFSSIENDCLLHELGHAKQSLMLGPFYLIVVGIPSLSRVVYRCLYRRILGFAWNNYYNGFPENWADSLGGIPIPKKNNTKAIRNRVASKHFHLSSDFLINQLHSIRGRSLS